MLEIESRAQCMLGKHSTTERHPQTLTPFNLNRPQKRFGVNLWEKWIVQIPRSWGIVSASKWYMMDSLWVVEAEVTWQECLLPSHDHLLFRTLSCHCFRITPFGLTRSLLNWHWEKGSCHSLVPQPQVHHLCAKSTLGRINTNPEEPHPLSPGRSCSASALGVTVTASVFEEAAPGYHQHTYSRKGWAFSEKGGKQWLQLKL